MTKIIKPINQNYVSQEKVVTEDKQNKKNKMGGELTPLPPKHNNMKSALKNKVKNKSGLAKIMWWNKGNSNFNSKKDEVEHMIDKYNPAIFGIIEANMGVQCHAPSLEIPGYKLERDNLSKADIKTRTAAYILETISYKRRTDLEIDATPLIWLEIAATKAKSWLLAIGYRQWRTLKGKKSATSMSMSAQLDRFSNWCNSWQKANSEGKPVFIIGDLNIDVSAWSKKSSEKTPYQNSKSDLLNMLKETSYQLSLTLIKTPPTRFQGGDEPSTLDIILSNKPELINTPLLVQTTSDHKLVIFRKEVKMRQNMIPSRKARSFKNYTREKLLQNLDMPKLNKLLNSKNPDYVADVLVEEVNRILDIVAPVKTVQIRKNYAAHLTIHTKELMKKRDEIKEKAQKSKSEDDRNEYKKLRNEAIKAQRTNKRDWANNLLNKEGNQSRHLWATIKKISGDSGNKTISCLNIDNIMVTKEAEIANALNTHFVDKVEKLITNMPKPKEDILNKLINTPTPAGDQMNLMIITEHELNTIIRKMKKTASCGSDSVSGIILSDLYMSIKRILLHAINLSLDTCVYPKRFKLTKLIPLVKTGKNPLDMANYRPISNLCTLGKIYEEAFFNQTSKFINQSGLLNKDQHGGRSNHSTTTCLAELWEEAKKATTNKEKASILALDMSAAYDLCNHQILVEKCRLLKIGKNATKWIQNFLKDRKQYVELGGSKSDTLSTRPNGVVQGGKSSGELFLYYLNDLPLQLNIKLNPNDNGSSIGKEFVDDVNILSKAPTIPELIKQVQSDFSKIHNYLVNHKMAINPNKSQFMVLLPPKEKDDIKISIDNHIIHHQEEIKTLGVTLAENMKFDTHLWSGKDSMVKSLNRKIALLKTIKPFVTQTALCQVGASLINSSILYAAPVWGATTQANIQKVQSLQIRAARVVKGKSWQRAKKKQHRQELLDELNWPNTNQIIYSASMNLAKKACTANSSAGLNQLFKVTKSQKARTGPTLRIDHKGKSNNSSNIFSVNAPLLFNNLPTELKHPLLTVNQFKTKLKRVTRSRNLLPKHINKCSQTNAHTTEEKKEKRKKGIHTHP